MSDQNILASFLSAEEAASFQMKMMQLLSEEILRFNKKKSSSIQVEKAQSILESILYGISAYLRTLPDPAAAMREQDIGEMRKASIELLKQYMEEARTMLEGVRATRTPTELIAYNGTIDVALEGFFQLYDPEFAAQETTAILDYPLYRDDRSMTGVLYIRGYLTRLRHENEFCAKYSKNHIRSLLVAHGLRHHLDYREMLVNIPELILEQENRDDMPDLYHL